MTFCVKVSTHLQYAMITVLLGSWLYNSPLFSPPLPSHQWVVPFPPTEDLVSHFLFFTCSFDTMKISNKILTGRAVEVFSQILCQDLKYSVVAVSTVTCVCNPNYLVRNCLKNIFKF